jgi:cellulose biosynthesis protein BcsQ
MKKILGVDKKTPRLLSNISNYYNIAFHGPIILYLHSEVKCFCGLTGVKKRGIVVVMIDLNKIRSLKTLNEMKKDLKEFVTNPVILTVYIEDYGWGMEDYEADKEAAEELLEKIERRYLSLEKYLKGQTIKRISHRTPKSETEATPSEQ